MANVGTGSAGNTLIGTGNGSSPTFKPIGTNSGLTAHGIVIAEGSGAFVASAALTNGQLLIGSTGLDPVAATLTAGSGISITNSAGGITIAASGGVVTETLTGNSGGAVSPAAGNVNTVGTGSITVVGNPGTNTLTTELTGLTNHALQVGAGTATLTQLGAGTTGQVLQTNTGADPTWSTATYPSTTTINQILYSSSANVVSSLATANNGVLTTGAAGVPVITALASNGQLIIGSGSGAPAAATLTAGTGVTITNGANSITIAATGGSFAWVDVAAATQALSVQTGYITDHSGGVVYTLPATAALGDQIRILGKQTSWSIAQNATQQIVVGSASSTVGTGGSVASTNLGDCIWLVCITAGTATVWRAESYVGNLTVT
jgi:hypothetical protein